MAETNNNTEKSTCKNKITALSKELKLLKEQLEFQANQIETLKKVLKTK